MKELITIDRQSTGFYWPGKCNTFSVIVKAIIEMTTLTPGLTRALAGVQTVVPAPRTFNEALFAASRPFSKYELANDSNSKPTSRQRLGVESSRAAVSDGSATIPERHSQQTALVQQVILPQSTPVTNSGVISIPMPFALPVTSPDASNIVPDQPMGYVVAQGMAGTESNNVQTGVVQPGGDSSQTPSIWSGLTNHGLNASLLKPANEGSNALVTEASNTLQNSSPVVEANASPDGSQGSLSSMGQNVDSDIPLKAGPVSSPRAALNASPKGAVASMLLTDSTVQDLPPTAATDECALAVSSLNSSSIATDQLAAFTQPGGGLAGTGHAGVTNLNSSAATKPSATALSGGKDGSKIAINEVQTPKQQVQSASGQAGSNSGSQDAPQSGDQSQGGNSIQGQNAIPALVNFTNHSVAFNVHVQSSANDSAGQTAAMTKGGAGSAAKIADAAPISVAAPQVLPLISTARLIQSMGQSEMRVGMRSNEFGNISISTSSTRDSISAQISVDHGELAKAIAASLPEMQARLGGNKAVDVRVDMNGAGIGQGSGTSGETLNGSADQSRRGGQQTGSSASGNSGSGVPERMTSPANAVMTTSNGGLNPRLDIRV